MYALPSAATVPRTHENSTPKRFRSLSRSPGRFGRAGGGGEKGAVDHLEDDTADSFKIDCFAPDDLEDQALAEGDQAAGEGVGIDTGADLAAGLAALDEVDDGAADGAEAAYDAVVDARVAQGLGPALDADAAHVHAPLVA